MTAPLEEFQQLFELQLDGICSEAQRRRYETLLRANPELVAEHAAQMRLHAMLRWRSGAASIRPQKQNVLRSGQWRRWAAAAMVLLSAGTVFYFLRSSPQSAIASLVESENVVWSSGETQLASGARLSAREIKIDAGRMKFIFDCGAAVTLEGPAAAQIIDGKTLRVDRGMLTALIENKAAGFSITTPLTRVLDLGTEFGVDVSESGQTDVVVFVGKVELTQTKADVSSSVLNQGEAVRVDVKGTVSPIVVLRREFHDKKWSASSAPSSHAVIGNVRDNQQDSKNRKYYQVVAGGMDEGVLAFVDRNHRWRAAAGAGLPAGLRGADLVMTYNDDKREPLQIDVTLARPARLFVLMDRRHPRPEWLRSAFALVSSDLIIDEGAGVIHVYEVWEKSVAAGVVTLGGNTGESMYGIAAIADR